MSKFEDFETSYERALLAVKARKQASRLARPGLPHKYQRIHYEIQEVKEVLDLVDKHGLYLVAESLSEVGFRNARAAMSARDRRYGEDLFSISKKLMITIADHHEAVNQIAGTTHKGPSDKKMAEIVDAIGFHEVIVALADSVDMMSEKILIAGDRATTSKLLTLKRALESVARQAKVLTYSP